MCKKKKLTESSKVIWINCKVLQVGLRWTDQIIEEWKMSSQPRLTKIPLNLREKHYRAYGLRGLELKVRFLVCLGWQDVEVGQA